jgi:hypothetical protein
MVLVVTVDRRELWLFMVHVLHVASDGSLLSGTEGRGPPCKAM